MCVCVLNIDTQVAKLARDLKAKAELSGAVVGGMSGASSLATGVMEGETALISGGSPSLPQDTAQPTCECCVYNVQTTLSSSLIVLQIIMMCLFQAQMIHNVGFDACLLLLCLYTLQVTRRVTPSLELTDTLLLIFLIPIFCT